MEYDCTILWGNIVENATTYRHRGRFISANFQHKGKGRHKVIRVVDSMNLFNCKAEKLGEWMKIPKLPMDYSRLKMGMTVTEDDWLYCEQDCRIIGTAIKKFVKIIRDTFDIRDVPMTISGIGEYLNVMDMADDEQENEDGTVTILKRGILKKMVNKKGRIIYSMFKSEKLEEYAKEYICRRVHPCI